VQIITDFLSVLQTQFSGTNLQYFVIIVESVLSLSRPVTTLSVARMSSLSYRTIQRFYALKDINWLMVNLLLFKTFLYQENKVYLLAADETVENKAGKQTYGIGMFYSSIVQKAIRSISFLAISIIDVEEEKSFFLACHQIMPTVKTSKPTRPKEKSENVKPKGRPKGSKNKPKTESTAHSYQALKTLLELSITQLRFFLPALRCWHLVLDGFYGHEDYLLLALHHKLAIISKFKTNAHLILPFDGLQSGKGRPKTKGDKVDLNKIDEPFFVETLNDTDSKVSTKVYQFRAYTPRISRYLLNIVVLKHTHQITKKESHTILFTNDLKLTTSQVIKYYSLRFQIEFDFPDAKQFYGLSDFKNYKQTQLTNAVNLSFTMTLLGKLILEKYKMKFNCPTMGISDLKTICKVQKHAQTFFNYNKTDPDDFLSSPQFVNLARLEAIHI
jgi:putative transposase